MRLQIKELTGPDEIRLNEKSRINYLEVSNSTAENVFCCKLNRYIKDEDTFPLSASVKIYNHEGTHQNTIIFNVTKNNIVDGRMFYFSLTPSKNLGGTYFYIQALLNNTISTATNTISFEHNNYHSTIKKVFIYTKRKFTHVYWSSNELITKPDQEEDKRDSISQNEDAFLHIKAQGMYKETIGLFIHAGKIMLKQSRITLNQNKKVVAVNMNEIISRYRIQTNNPTGPVNISLTASVSVKDDSLTTNNHTQDINPAIRIIQDLSRKLLFHLIFIIKQSNLLSVTLTDAEEPKRRSSTGTVYVNLNTDNPESVTATEYTDFPLGYVGHLLSTGTIHQGIATSWSVGGVARYPFNFYELWLSDMVECGLVSVQDARILTLDSDGETLKTAEQMVESFNKYTPFNGKSMIQRVSNGTNIDKEQVKKVLQQVMSHRRLDNTFYVCRDAWQTKGGGNGVTPTIRYAKNGAECPPGGYTINFTDGTFEVYFANTNATQSKAINVQKHARSGLAIHRGDSYTATGCTTLYCKYSGTTGSTTQLNFLEYLFLTRTLTSRQKSDRKRLILAYIEERNALQTLKYSSRWYDIIAPGKCIGNIEGPKNIVSGETASYNLVIDKKHLATGDSITSEEIQSIRWEYKIGKAGYQQLTANGQTTATLPTQDAWVGKEITIRAKVTLSIEHGGIHLDNFSKTTKVLKKSNK